MFRQIAVLTLIATFVWFANPLGSAEAVSIQLKSLGPEGGFDSLADAASYYNGRFMEAIHFRLWMHEHGASYKTIRETEKRFELFRHNTAMIYAANAAERNNTLEDAMSEDTWKIVTNDKNDTCTDRDEKRESVATYNVNKFTDMSEDEYRRMLGYNPANRTKRRRDTRIKTFDGTAPTKIDWRQKGAVTAVKDQGQCGSCWSFSATGSMEGAHFIAKNESVVLSEAQLVDCDSTDGGCNGGLMENAFKYVIKNGGIDTEQDYPYEPMDASCDSQKAKKHAAKFSSWKAVTPNREDQLRLAVAQHGPISVAVEADQQAWMGYQSGVVTSDSCGTNLDHGVLVVGYDSEANPPYWIVKNSWGEDWGMDGYIHLEMGNHGPEGQCGIAMDPSFPVSA